MGKKSGPELTALVAKAAIRTNSYILLVTDGEKAFRNLSRRRVHSEIAQQTPALLGLVQTYYGTLPTSNFMLVNGKARCIQQHEGVTIGDALGTFACCSTLAPVYAMVDQQLRGLMEDISPGAGEAVFNLAFTDDLLSLIPVPEGVTEAGQWRG